jgi:alanyl-tRNA synthetase
LLSREIRRQYLKFFEERGHVLVPSSPVVPHGDPTLLFVNAGMNQFKDVFLGQGERGYQRAVSCQKCIRAGGKHNDLEQVGHTTRHLTFFEMLGNFSFGDYFKEQAIQMAWELITQVVGFDVERLWPTVYKDDEEAFELWARHVPKKRITRLGEKDNFWAMGDTGPCGPCTELLFDRGAAFGDARSPADDVSGERFFEAWNLVFMQYNRKESGSLEPLPRVAVDTGAGLERLVALKMGVTTLFETDIVRALIGQVEKQAQKRYEPNTPLAPAFRVVADHLRSLSFAIADGAQPSNVERGYVLRKLLRRAVRYGRQLGFERPFLGDLVPTLVELMGEEYPELGQARERIVELLTSEEEAFLRTLKRGGNLLSHVVESARAERRPISGDEAFKLKDTYGMPLDELMLLARDAGLTVDEERYEQLEQEARDRSRGAQKGKAQVKAAAIEGLEGTTQFLGYAQLEAAARIVALSDDWIVLDRTPFYAEKGGQVGDTGTLDRPDFLFEVTDTQELQPGVTGHLGKLMRGQPKVGMEVMARVNGQRRQEIANSHTATHLLNLALQNILGGHVRQAGSVVEPERLRFDFSHHKSLTSEELLAIEELVNQQIRANHPVQAYEMAYSEAQKRGDILQFFGEKYGTQVRVIEAGPSKELCGGTHTSATGNIGLLRLMREGSISAGVRRIEAVTGEEALRHSRHGEQVCSQIAEQLKVPSAQLLVRVEELIEANRELTQQLRGLQLQALGALAQGLAEKSRTLGGALAIVEQVELPSEQLRDLVDQLAQQCPDTLVIVGCRQDGKCQLVAKAPASLIAQGLGADRLLREVAPLIGGGAGGKPAAAQAGGRNPEALAVALARAEQLISEWSSKS